MSDELLNELVLQASSKGYRTPSANSEILYMELCFIQKWLRDKHKIAVEPKILANGTYTFRLVNNTNNVAPLKDGFALFRSVAILPGGTSYEQALATGIEYALNLIP